LGIGNELIQFFHIFFGIGNALRPGADAGLNMLSLGYQVYQILFLFFERESTSFSGKPRDNDRSLGRRPFPLFDYFEFYSMRAGVSEPDPIQRWNADLDDLASKHRRSPL